MSLEYRRDEAGISTTIIEEVSALDVIFHVLLKGQSNRQGITFIYPLCVFPEIKPMVLFAPYASRGTTVAVQLRHIGISLSGSPFLIVWERKRVCWYLII